MVTLHTLYLQSCRGIWVHILINPPIFPELLGAAQVLLDNIKQKLGSTGVQAAQYTSA